MIIRHVMQFPKTFLLIGNNISSSQGLITCTLSRRKTFPILCGDILGPVHTLRRSMSNLTTAQSNLHSTSIKVINRIPLISSSFNYTYKTKSSINYTKQSFSSTSSPNSTSSSSNSPPSNDPQHVLLPPSTIPLVNSLNEITFQHGIIFMISVACMEGLFWQITYFIMKSFDFHFSYEFILAAVLSIPLRKTPFIKPTIVLVLTPLVNRISPIFSDVKISRASVWGKGTEPSSQLSSVLKSRLSSFVAKYFRKASGTYSTLGGLIIYRYAGLIVIFTCYICIHFFGVSQSTLASFISNLPYVQQFTPREGESSMLVDVWGSIVLSGIAFPITLGFAFGISKLIVHLIKKIR